MSILRFYNHIAMAVVYGKGNRYALRQLLFNTIRAVNVDHKYKWTDPATEEFKKDVVPGYK